MTQLPARIIGLVLGLAICAAPAVAQDDPRFALVASFPSPTISFQWELSETFALRLEGSYRYESSELSESSGSSVGGATEHVYRDGTTTQVIFVDPGAESHTQSTSHNGSIGIAGIFSIHRSDQLRLYVAPRVSVTRSSQRITSTTTLTRFPPDLPQSLLNEIFPPSLTFESSSTSPSAGASFGAATNVHRRLALFGEAGFTYQRSDQPLGVVGGITTSINGITGTTTIGPDESRRTTISTRAVGGVMFLF